MKKAIVTTTINAPTVALRKFAEIAEQDGWGLVIIGDQKTPHSAYQSFVEEYPNTQYIPPSEQILISDKLSDLIGWNCIQRRNFGFIVALKAGAEIIATVDDDNIPKPGWGKNVKVGQEEPVAVYSLNPERLPVFDPLSVAFPQLWHRGFPVELIPKRYITKPQLQKRRVMVQADLWDGDPDIDAICRIGYQPNVKFKENIIHYGSNVMSPFNSQNTFLSADCFPNYFLFPHIGRMDDIWASYILQWCYPDSVVYAKASVDQERNEHNLVKDLEAEMLGYKHSLELVEWLRDNTPNKVIGPEAPDMPGFIPTRALEAWAEFTKIILSFK